MMPDSHPATSSAPNRGATATTRPATTSMTPTMYIAVSALPGMIESNCVDRYFVQSSVRTPANLSRPNRIGATVNAIRSSRKACTAGSLRTAARVGSGAVIVVMPPLRPRAADFLPGQRLRVFDPRPARLVVLVTPVREHPDRRAVAPVPHRERAVAMLDHARLVVAVAPRRPLDRPLADGREDRGCRIPLRLLT